MKPYEPYPIPSAAATDPATVGAKEQPSPALFDPDLRERIGRCFVEFCQAQRSVFDLEEFEVMLGKDVPKARMQLAYRSSPAACFYAEPPQTSYSRAWLVRAGASLYLLPWAISADEFDTVRECFVVSPGTMPLNLADCLPAVLVVQGKRWVVHGENQGRLSQHPVENPTARSPRSRSALGLWRQWSAETGTAFPPLPGIWSFGVARVLS